MFEEEREEILELDGDDNFLPEGYEPGTDIFALGGDPTTEGSLEQLYDETQNTEAELGEAETDTDEGTDGQEGVDEHQTDEGITDEAKVEGTEVDLVPITEQVPQKLKVRYNHEDLELTPEEAVQYAQKGLNYDKVLERLQQAEKQNANAAEIAKVLGYESAEDMFADTRTSIREQRVQKYVNDDGIPEPLARYLVEQEIGKEEQAAKDYVAATIEPTAIEQQSDIAPKQPEKKSLVSDSDMAAFVKAHPGVTKLPQEVINAVIAGANISVAYAEYESKKDKEEIRILKQNQAAAERAPVSGVSKHGSTIHKGDKDPFEAGFDGDDW